MARWRPLLSAAITSYWQRKSKKLFWKLHTNSNIQRQVFTWNRFIGQKCRHCEILGCWKAHAAWRRKGSLRRNPDPELGSYTSRTSGRSLRRTGLGAGDATCVDGAWRLSFTEQQLDENYPQSSEHRRTGRGNSGNYHPQRERGRTLWGISSWRGKPTDSNSTSNKVATSWLTMFCLVYHLLFEWYRLCCNSMWSSSMLPWM